MSSDTERRASFRVRETVFISYDVIDEHEFALGIARWRMKSGKASRVRVQLVDLDARLAELVFLAGNDSAAVGEALRLINDKLNIIANALPEASELASRLADSRPRPCQLSSEGMLFGLDEELAEGTRVVLEWIVQPDNRFFESFGTVVSCRVADDEAMGPFKHLVGVSFAGMSPAERECLIQHLFSRQSEDLRLRRKNAEKQADQT